jgi:hypothetical protein
LSDQRADGLSSPTRNRTNYFSQFPDEPPRSSWLWCIPLMLIFREQKGEVASHLRLWRSQNYFHDGARGQHSEFSDQIIAHFENNRWHRNMELFENAQGERDELRRNKGHKNCADFFNQIPRC